MKTKQKHSKKAVTLLTRIETLLADVLAECSAIEKTIEKNVRDLLRTAEVSIAQAKDFIAPILVTEVRHRAAAARKPRRVAARKTRPVARAPKRRAA